MAIGLLHGDPLHHHGWLLLVLAIGVGASSKLVCSNVSISSLVSACVGVVLSVRGAARSRVLEMLGTTLCLPGCCVGFALGGNPGEW